MDPLDHVRAGLDGLACAVCNDPVPADAVHLVAHRDGLAFLEVECPVCRSTSLAFLVADTVDGNPVVRVPDEPGWRGSVTGDDVIDMHELLREWRGGLTELLDASGRAMPERR